MRCFRFLFSIVTLQLHSFIGSSQFNQFADCTLALTPCSKNFVIKELINSGATNESLGNNSCVSGLSFETNSAWLEFNISQDGSFAFEINPLVAKDDIDFLVFSNKAICSSLEPIRCMASGKNLGLEYINYNRCLGATGLRTTSMDVNEYNGCYGSADNFLSSFNVKKGDRYLLLINNHNSTNGFEFLFTGTANYVSKYPEIAYKWNNKEEDFSFNFYHKELNGLGGCRVSWQFNDPEGTQHFEGDNISSVKFKYPGVKQVIRNIESITGCIYSDTTNVELRSISQSNSKLDQVLSNIFPNPARNNIYFEISVKNEKKLIISTTDITGKNVLPDEVVNISKYKLLTKNVESLIPGTYILTLSEEKTNKIIDSKKFVIPD